MTRFARAALLAFATAIPAASQPAASPPGRVVPEPPRGASGLVLSATDDSVVLRQVDGTTVTVPMTRGWTVGKLRKGTIGELRLGDFIGSANSDLGPDSGRANELRVFEPGYRPEYGTHSIAAAGTSMTHGFVFGIEKHPDGTRLEVAYPGGRRAILIPEGLEVTITDLQPRSIAAPGRAVSAVMRTSSDGIRRASRLVLSEPENGDRK
jgi:hypothetical protein